ncbi:MAG TPA: protein phosphatase 2C domain-containing protein, partial [Ktedonobacterales bacterium]|nr:protein phosphatase 2C domain-containing protein [Ktedonobacterales bacterium]
MRRPPRPLRARDSEEAPGDQENAGDDAASAEIPDTETAKLPAASAESPVETEPMPVAVAVIEDGEPDEEETAVSLSPEEVEDAPTMEYDTVGASSSAPSASSPNIEAPAATSPADGLPWPLPTSMIIGGRYRVEELLKAASDERNSENIYHVSDLQAYEECWACHAQHGIEAASEQYCPECGADMLARVFLMYERLLAPPGSGESGEEDLHEAPTLRDMPVEGEQRIFEQGARLYRVVAQALEEVLFPKGPRVVGASASDAGLTRAADHNEDSLGLVIFSTTHNSRTEPLALAAVADGLGGHASGMDASRTVIQVMMERVLREVLTTRWEGSDEEQDLDLEALLREGARAANKALCEINKATEIDSGSTLVSAIIFGDTACIANMGDSRAYVLDRGQLCRVSVDHSLVEQFVGAGMITDEERYSHPQRNQVFRSLGSEENLEPDVFTQKLRPGMRFLLCSDGLWEMVRDDEIAHILRETPTVQQACDALIAAANAHGGEDNIAAVILEVDA